MLGEPTNDLDTDMLAAIEDLLDSWPGTLIVVSHDRYFLERVTDQQFAILDRRLRHLPGGIDQYLRLRAEQQQAESETSVSASDAGGASARTSAHSQPQQAVLSGAELRAAEKELAAIERKMDRLQNDIVRSRDGLAELDQSDYQLLGVEMAKIVAFEDEVAELEERWLVLSEQLG